MYYKQHLKLMYILMIVAICNNTILTQRLLYQGLLKRWDQARREGWTIWFKDLIDPVRLLTFSWVLQSRDAVLFFFLPLDWMIFFWNWVSDSNIFSQYFIFVILKISIILSLVRMTTIYKFNTISRINLIFIDVMLMFFI